MPFTIVRDNIVNQHVDAIVNAANPRLMAGGGVCGAIFAAAGAARLTAACRALGSCPVGQAVATPGFRLHAKYILHAVGPVWQGGLQGEPELLFACYAETLDLAARLHCRSVALPLISTGSYGYPKAEALQLALSAIGGFLDLHPDMDVRLVVFTADALRLSEERFGAITSYIDDHYADAHDPGRTVSFLAGSTIPLCAPAPDDEEERSPLSYDRAMPPCADFGERMPLPCAAAPCTAPVPELREVLAHLSDTFSQAVLHWIDRKHLTDTEVYKRANLDRKTFSKLRCAKEYQPSKATAVALCFGLELGLDDARDLLGRAGYALSPASRSDLIVQYHLSHGLFSLPEVEAALYAFGEDCLRSLA